jgi:cytochrome c oxidase assembly protein subunit 15
LTLGQAILGGITVLTGLSPITVSAHFILSAAIVTLSVKLWWTYKGHSIPTIHRVINTMANIIFVVAAAVVILGVITTGSGPHSGDINAENRFGFDPRVIAWLHADAVWLFVGLIIALWILRALKQLPQSSNRYLQAVTHITIVQAIVGYTQFFTGLPALLVAIHVALAATLWAYVNVLVLSMKLPSE